MLRPTAVERGYTLVWRRFSIAYRQQHPVCMMCLVKPSECVDHIEAMTGPDDPRWYDESNLRASKSCH